MTRTHTVIISLLLVYCTCFHLVNPAKTFKTSGTSGVSCGSGPQCLGHNQAGCFDGKCECKSPYKGGIGHFVCPRKDEKFCAIFNDPMARGFDGSHVKVPLMFKFSASHINTRTCKTDKHNKVTMTSGQCIIKVMGWGGRRLGKTFLKGFEVIVALLLHGKAYFHSTQITASAHNGVYKFVEGGNKIPWGGTQYGDPVTTDIPGHTAIHTFYDDVDNFAKMIIDACGVEVGIRGVEKIGDPLKTASGMYIKVKDGCFPQFPKTERNLCVPPYGKGDSLDVQVQNLKDEIGRDVSKEIATLLKVLTADVVQIFPGAPNVLQTLTDTCLDCEVPNLVHAIEICTFLIEDPNFFRCFDTTIKGEEVLQLLVSCIFSICDGSSRECGNVKHTIGKRKECPLPIHFTIMNHTCIFG